MARFWPPVDGQLQHHASHQIKSRVGGGVISSSIALLVPAPRQQEITYPGLLDANAKYGSNVVRVPTRRVKPRIAGAQAVGDNANNPPSPEPRSTMSWAEILRRTFAFDVLHGARCAGRARGIRRHHYADGHQKVLTHLYINEAGNPASARRPPHDPAPPTHISHPESLGRALRYSSPTHSSVLSPKPYAAMMPWARPSSTPSSRGSGQS